jgi:subtilisin-like proprotein convertase family protein
MKMSGRIALGVGLFVLVIPASASAAETTFANSANITIPTSGAATPYPSQIAVSGLESPVQEVEATLQNVDHQCLYDVDVLLVGPSGAKTMLLSDGGTGTCQAQPVATDLNITLDDDAATVYPCGTNVSGTFKPTDDPPGSCIKADDPFTAPAPPGPYPAALSEFDGTNPNGTWSLFVIDDLSTYSGAIQQGWSLKLTTADPPAPPAPPDTSSPNATITKGPKDKTKKKTATFEFTGTDTRAIATFQCRLDNGAFAACTSPFTVKVKKGRHNFQVRAVDEAGNVGSAAKDDWKVKKKKRR